MVIALGQLDNFFGTTSQGSTAVEKVLSYFTVGFSVNPAAVLLGSAIIVFMIVYPKKWNAVVPASLVSIILATAASLIIPMDIQRVGEIPLQPAAAGALYSGWTGSGYGARPAGSRRQYCGPGYD